MGGFAFNFGSGGGGSSIGSIPPPVSIFDAGAGLPKQSNIPASNFDSGDAVNLISSLSNIGLGIYQTVQRGDLQSQLITSGNSGTVAQGARGTTDVATGGATFGSSGSILGIPIIWIVVALVALVVLRR